MKFLIKTETWERYSKRLFGLAFLLIFILGFLYVYFMNLAVFKTAERKDNLENLSKIKRDLQQLEASYIAELNQYDLSYAKSLGFVEAEPDAYFSLSGIVAKATDYGGIIR